MPRIRHWVSILVVWEGLVAGVAWAEALRPFDTLLPKTTVGMLSVPNIDNLKEHWKKTQLGKLLDDPVMQPFEKDVRQQTHRRWAEVGDRLAVTLEDLEGVPSGEIAVAMVEPKPGEAASTMLIDVTGHLAQAKALLTKAQANFIKQGVKESRLTLGGALVLIYDLPLPKEEQEANSTEGKAAEAVTRQTIYFLTQNLLGVSDDLRVVRGILGRLAEQSAAGSLAEVVAYQMVMKRCATDAGAEKPLIRWFVYPLGYAEAARAATPKDQRRRGKTILEVLRHQGFGAVQGVGGHFYLASEGCQVIYRTAVYAPPPHIKSMQMFVLPNKTDFAPQAWVPPDISTYTTLYVDIVNAFDNFGSLYDEIVGEEGIWSQTLRGMKEDPNGPQIDLREELIQQLGQRVTMITDYKTPITTSSERLLFGIEVKDEKAVAKAIEKSVKNDPSAKKRVIDGRVIWEIVEEEQAAVPTIDLDVPSLTRKKETPKTKDEDEDAEKQSHFLPHAAITVAHGQLLVASHIDFLVKVLKPAETPNLLAKNQEFQKVWSLVDKTLGAGGQCAREFSFTDEEVRPTYELIRQGKMPESESLLGRGLNTLAGAGKKGAVRQQRISGKNLPDYEMVRRVLGSAAVTVTSEPNGWFMKGVLLPR